MDTHTFEVFVDLAPQIRRVLTGQQRNDRTGIAAPVTSVARGTFTFVQLFTRADIAFGARNLQYPFGRLQTRQGIEARIVFIHRRQPCGQLDGCQVRSDILNVVVRHLAIVDVLDHREVGAFAFAKQHQLVDQKLVRLTGDARILALFTTFAELAMTAGADLVDFLTHVEIRLTRLCDADHEGQHNSDNSNP